MSVTTKKSVLIQSKIDPSLKTQSEDILEQLGLNMSRAIEVFLRQVVVQRGLPFKVVLTPADNTASRLTKQDKKDILSAIARVKSGKVVSFESEKDMENYFGNL
jgi:DNA-damage-inducible protein J